MSHGHGKTGEYDVFKQSLLRYAGYANELGEAFRPLIPSWIVASSYVVAFGYAAGDAVDKGYKAFSRNKNDAQRQKWETIDKTLDTFLWQFFASVTVPAFFVNRAVVISKKIMENMAQKGRTISPQLMRWAPTCLGLAIIPALPLIIDPIVDIGLDKTYRPFIQKQKPYKE